MPRWSKLPPSVTNGAGSRKFPPKFWPAGMSKLRRLGGLADSLSETPDHDGPGGSHERDRANRLAAVNKALADVVDPETGLSLVSLAMIADVVIEGSNIWVVLLTSQRESPITTMRRLAIERALFDLPGVTGIEVMLSYDPNAQPVLD